MNQLAFFTCLIAFLSGCKNGNDTALPDSASSSPNVVSLSVEDYSFQAPDTIDAGWTTFQFVNRGHETHYAHAVRLDSGRSVTGFVEAYAEAIRDAGARPAGITRFGGPGATSPGDTSVVTQYMESGQFVWICPIEGLEQTPHFSKGEVRPFVVREIDTESGQPAGPKASTDIRLMDYGFRVEPPLTPGQHMIRIVNDGPNPHDVELARLSDGKTADDVRVWFQGGQGAPPVDELAGGVGVIAPGMEAYVVADLTIGDYVLVCFATSDDGRTHVEHGMIEQITVQ